MFLIITSHDCVESVLEGPSSQDVRVLQEEFLNSDGRRVRSRFKEKFVAWLKRSKGFHERGDWEAV